jgi:hypothetical protein
MRFHDRVAHHDYEGPAFNRGEKERLVAHLGSKTTLDNEATTTLPCALDRVDRSYRD